MLGDTDTKGSNKQAHIRQLQKHKRLKKSIFKVYIVLKLDLQKSRTSFVPVAK